MKNDPLADLGHFILCGLTVVWLYVVVVVFNSLPLNLGIGWLTFAGFLTFSFLVEGTQFESLVMEFRKRGHSLRESVSLATKAMIEDTMHDVFLCNLLGAVLLGACFISLLI